MDRFWNVIEQHKQDHSCLPFWSWNDRLEQQELRRQIDLMRKAGLGGYFMHARGGLETPYMGDEWMDAVQTGVDAAGDDLQAWAYDENGWPSGFANGIVPQMGVEHQQKTLVRRIVGKDAIDPDTVLGYYRRVGDDLEMVDTPADGDLAVVCIVNQYYIDTMIADTIRLFLDSTHEQYYARFGADFGKRLKGFFTDEPQYGAYNTPWSPKLEDAWRERFGEELRPKLGWLFMTGAGSRKLRARYYALAGELYRERFIKQMYDWCTEHGCELTGHVMQEDNLLVQLGATGGAMPCYEYFHMPGIDWLGRAVGTPVTPKQVGSAAAQLGRTRVLTESFALCGWDVPFNELRRIMGWQFVSGVNRICQHLSAYSLRGLRKRDFPPSLHVQQPWFEEYSGFNDYATRLGSALAQGKDAADVLLMQPRQAAAAVFDVYGADEFDRARTADAAKVNQTFEQTSVRLNALHINHHYGDEVLMQKFGSVDGAALTVGQMTYHTVVLPSCTTLPKAVAQLLLDFAQNGGRIYAVGDALCEIDAERDLLADELNRYVQPLADDDAAWRIALGGENCLSITQNGVECASLSCMVRRLDDGRRLFYITNLTQDDLGECSISVAGAHGVLELDLIGAREHAVAVDHCDGHTAWTASFASSEGRVFIETDAVVGATSLPKTQRLMPQTLTLCDRTDNLFTLDMCECRIDGGVWQPKKSVILLQNELLALRRACKVDLRFTFTVRDLERVGAVSLVMETPHQFRLTLNGNPYTFVDAGHVGDYAFRKSDVRTCLREGINELIVSADFYQRDKVYAVLFGDNVHETEKNKLTLDTELESVYLVGDFGVTFDGETRRGDRRAIWTEKSGEFVMTPAPKAVDMTDITPNGFWFFAGRMRFGGNVTVTKEANTDYYVSLTTLKSPAAVVWVNGQKAGTLAFAPYRVTVTDLLCDGENRIEIELLSGNRNWLGPYHRPVGESYMVTPATFADERSWADEQQTGPYWTDDYCFVEFGGEV